MLLKIYRHIIDYLLPKRCFACAELTQDSGGFCAPCWHSFNFVARPFCKSCGRMFTLNIEGEQTCLGCIKTPPPYDMARAIFKFDEKSKKLIHAFKYYDKTILGEKFAEMLVARYRDEVEGSDLILPVPMHKLKRLMRMYNQAGVLALALGNRLGKPVLQDVLVKKKWTRAQTLLPRASRLKNVAGSIAVSNAEVVRGKSVILVDDVMTTGATVSACASALKKAGAREVIVLSAAST